MKQLRIENNEIVNLPGFRGGDARIAECETAQEFAVWSNGSSPAGETLAARYQDQIYIKTPQTLSDDGEFSLEYDCLPLEEANQRIEQWNTRHEHS